MTIQRSPETTQAEGRSASTSAAERISALPKGPKMTVYLTLRAGAGGTPEEAIGDALKAAQRIDLWTEVEINGVRVLIHPGDRLSTLVDAWRKAMARGVDFCSANVIPAGRTTADVQTPNTFVVGKPAPYFCPACQAVPRAGYCKLAGCPTAPAVQEQADG